MQKNNSGTIETTIDGLIKLVRFYGISTFVGYLNPNLFLCK